MTGRESALKLTIGGGVFVLIAAAVFVLWFFSGDAPAEVDLAQTASAVTQPEDGSAAGAGEIAGTWTVDDTVGAFTVDDETTASFAGFRVDEELASIGSTTAVGRTPAVTGTLVIEDTSLISATVVADLTQIVSDETRRDDSIQRSLGTSTNPEATFVLTEPIELGDSASSGETMEVTAVGDLTINGITNSAEMTLSAQLVGDMILVTGSSDIVFSDFDVTTPTAPVVLSVEDHGIIELQLWFKAA